MTKEDYGTSGTTVIDVCETCDGIWLDASELVQIQAHFEAASDSEKQQAGYSAEKVDTCPKCGQLQVMRNQHCLACGFDLVAGGTLNNAGQATGDKTQYLHGKEPKAGLFNTIGFVRDEIIQLPGIDKKPVDGISSFNSRIGYTIGLAFKEKEIFFFALLQWASIGIAYLLWVQMLDWIPEEVWRSAAESDEGSVADYVLLAWSFVCVGVAAFPVGILTGCMGATHFLHKQGRESTVATCLKLVLPQSWSLWSFHWIDGWITVNQILDRLPKEGGRKNPVLSEALYYAWKLGISGVLPSIVTGNNLIKSGKNSVVFVKDNFVEVAKLRAGYSAVCWIVGIGAYIGAILLFMVVDIVPEGDEIYGHIYTFYFWAAVPILIAVAIVMLFLRPIYVLALCDLYSDHLNRKGETANLPENPSKTMSALVAFWSFCIILAAVYTFRIELGIVALLSTPYGQ